MWDLIVSVPDHCLSFYFSQVIASDNESLSNAHNGPRSHSPQSVLSENYDTVEHLENRETYNQSASSLRLSLNVSGYDLSDKSGLNDFTFNSKGLHVANLNIRHLMHKVDEIRFMLANENAPDILGLCETSLDSNISDGQVTISGYKFLRYNRKSWW